MIYFQDRHREVSVVILEKKIIILLIVLWIITKPFIYLKYTNITIAIAFTLIAMHYNFGILYIQSNISAYKIVKNILSLVLVLSTVVFLITQIMISFSPYSDAKVKDTSDIDYIIVLGAGLRGKDLSQSLKFRLDKLLEIELARDTIIILSGGQGPDELITEAKAMKDYLLSNGISEERIILEEKSTSTFENFKFSLLKLKESNFIVDENSSFAIVSNDFHIFRSKYILKRLGYNSVGIAAKTPNKVKVDYFFREFYAVINTVLFDL